MGSCTFLDKGDVTPAMLEGLGFTFGNIYSSAENVKAAALAVKEANNRTFATVPFCHTVEAKALGGDIFPGDDTAGPRAGSYVCKGLDELKLRSMKDFPDVRHLVQACRDLKAAGEKVAWMITGPISTLSCLLPIEQIFKGWRKDADRMAEVLREYETVLLEEVELACDAGADLISYADPAGNTDILGPKNGAFMSREFTAPFLNKAMKLCEGRTKLSMCPLAAEALVKAKLWGADATGEGAVGQEVSCGCVKMMPAV